MPGFGFGFGFRTGRRKAVRARNPGTVNSIRPGPLWTGIAGSGFVQTPVDPVRITAKPAIRLITPPNQYFTHNLLVGVIAAANHGGTLLDNLGLEKVVAHYEGRSVDILAPSYQEITDVNGITRRYFGWWITLTRSGPGHANLYFEAVPKDASMQARVIGPWQFSPQTALHDRQLLVAPSQPAIAGARYQSIGAALGFLAQSNAQNPLITIIESGTYDIAPLSAAYQGRGYCKISAQVPITIGKAGYTTDSAALLRPRWDGLRFSGASITIDARFVSALYQEVATGRQHWLDGITVTNSAGRYAPWRGGTRPLGHFVRNNAWFTECTISALSNPCVNASLVRDCVLEGGYGDVATDAACVVHTSTNDWDSSDGWTLDVPSMTVAYSGTESTATLAISGGNDSSARTITATWGLNSAVLTVGSTEALMAANRYWVSDVANWLNGLGAGFSATVLDNTRRASALSIAGLKGAPFAARDVKAAPLSLVTMFDQHTDWFQQNNAGMLENCILANNVSTSIVGQDVFLTASGGTKDFLIFNNAFDNKLTTGSYSNNAFLASQFARAHSHVVIAHNSWASQGVLLRGDQAYAPDGYCLFANNAVRDIVWMGGGSPPASIIGNHLQQGAAGGAIGSNTTVGGLQSDCFADSGAGAFGARGPLQASRKQPVVALDRTGRNRGAADAVGSEAFFTAEVVEPAQPAIGSVQFPPFNRQYDGIAGTISYANSGLVQTPLLASGSPGAFFIMLQVPHERTNLNREYRVMGNGATGSSQIFSLSHYGDNHFDGPRHDEIRWRSRGSAGDLVDVSVDVQLRASQWQLIVVTCDGAGNFSIASYAPGTAKIAGTVQSSSTHSLNALAGTHVSLGDTASGAPGPAPYAAPAGAFDGAVAFHGFVLGDAGDDAKWQAICEGADIAQTLDAATAFRLMRDYRNGGATAQTLAPILPGDITAAGTIYGTIHGGGSVPYAQADRYLHVDRLPDGYVLCPPDGEDFGTVQLTGRSSGLIGALFGRIIAEDGEMVVPGFVIGEVGPDINFALKLPPFAGWGYLELWAESQPALVHRMNSRIGCGDKLSVIGQSQAFLMLNAGNVTLAPTGLASFCGFIGNVADPDDTTTAPVPRFSTSARPQLFIIPQQMTNAYNGVTAIAQRVGEHNQGRAVSVIGCAIPGTSARHWIDDAATQRQWAIDVEVADMAGRDRVPVWVWYSADAGYDYRQILDAVVFGTGPYAANRTLFDGSIQVAGYKLGVCLPTRATSTNDGPFDFDEFGFRRTYAQQGQIAWCNDHPDLGVIGPATTDLAIDNLASGSTTAPSINLGGPHQSQSAREGSWRLGYRVGETYLRARGLSPFPANPYVDPAQITINAARTEMLVKCVLPHQGTETGEGSAPGLRTADGRAVTGFELSTDGGATWTRSGFSASIVASDTVRITKTSGAWPAGLRLTYLRGGPFSYGTAEELNAHYKGSLYDGCAMEGGLGLPLLGIDAANGITV